MAINLKACNHFKLYNGKAAEVSDSDCTCLFLPALVFSMLSLHNVGLLFLREGSFILRGFVGNLINFFSVNDESRAVAVILLLTCLIVFFISAYLSSFHGFFLFFATSWLDTGSTMHESSSAESFFCSFASVSFGN